jgi:DNA polymerase I
MQKTEKNPPGYRQPPLTGGQSKYTDYAIISGLSGKWGKKDFVSWADIELETTLSDTPESRVWALSKMMDWELKINPPSPLCYNSPLEVRTQNLSQGGIETQSTSKSDYILILESDLIGVLAQMEMVWVAFDRTKLQDIGERIRSDIRRVETEIHELVWPINISSPKQLQVLFFETLGIKPTKKNKTGYSVDVDVLEEIARTHDVARLILEYRTLSKLSSTYVDGLMRAIGVDGRIHTTYDSLGAATGRMSSNDPNLQNIPTGDGYAREIKECFIATKASVIPGLSRDPAQKESKESGFLPTQEWQKQGIDNYSGNLLLVADYSQVEIRVLAFLSQDPGLLDAFERWEDIHMRTARFLFWDTRDITSHERRIAKSVNFGVIYGITGFWLAKTLDCSIHDAQRYVDAFYTKYPKVREYYDLLLENARWDGYVETYYWRRRYIRGIGDANKTIRSIAEREAMNMPIQGTAADMIKIAMIELDAKIRNKWLSGKMILQVHDELVFDIPVDEKEIFENMVREVMEGVLKNDTWWNKIPPITVDISTWKNWAEAK